MNALPDEILLEVLNHLVAAEFERNRCFVWSLCLVSRRFHRLIKAHLYHTFSFRHGHLLPFLRTISKCPDLAKCVKHVTWDQHHRPLSYQSFKIPSVSERAQIAARLQSLGTAPATRLAARFLSPTSRASNSQTEHEAFMFVLLLSLPGLETVNVLARDIWTMHEYWFYALEHPQSLTNLKNVRIGGGFGLRQVFLLLMIPSIRTLELDSFWFYGSQTLSEPPHGVETDRKHPGSLPEKTSSLEHLHIRKLLETTDELLDMFRVLRGLRTFEYQRVIAGPIPHIDEEDGIRTVLKCILSQSDSLESLYLRDWHAFPTETIFGVLRGVSHLRSLDIDASRFPKGVGPPDSPEFLVPFLRQLPVGLQCLTLAAYSLVGRKLVPHTTIVDALLAIAPTIDSILPSLTTLTISDWDPRQGTFPCQIQLSALQLAYAKVGIKLMSRPRDQMFEDDLYNLDYVEQGWVLIQPIEVKTGRWLKKCGHHGYLDTRGIVIAEIGEDDLIDVCTRDHAYQPCPASMLVMDQYLAEQSLWYWEELRAGTS